MILSALFLPLFTVVVDVVVVLVVVRLGLVSRWMPYGSIPPALLVLERKTSRDKRAAAKASGESRGGGGGGGGVCGDNRRRAGEDAQFPAYHWLSSLWVEPVSSTLVEGRQRAALLHSILISKWNRVAKTSASAHHDRRLGFSPSVGELGTVGVNLMSHFKRFGHHFNSTGIYLCTKQSSSSINLTAVTLPVH